MTRNDVIRKLEELESQYGLSKDKYVVGDYAALVLIGLKEECETIQLHFGFADFNQLKRLRQCNDNSGSGNKKDQESFMLEYGVEISNSMITSYVELLALKYRIQSPLDVIGSNRDDDYDCRIKIPKIINGMLNLKVSEDDINIRVQREYYKEHRKEILEERRKTIRESLKDIHA